MTAALTDPSPGKSGASGTPGRADTPGREALTEDADGRRLPPLRERLLPPLPTDRIWGWLVPLLISVLAGIARFHNLGHPRKFIFDETYYAKDAFALLNFGYERDFIDKANEQLLSGNTDVFAGVAFVVHPPGGKWQVAVGELLFGMTPFGWRFTVALLGTLSVLLIARVVRRLTRSAMLGCVAALLLSVDSLHLVESRTALLDLILMFWVIAALGCLLLDRDWSRRRLLNALDGRERVAPGTWGPWLWWRPWRLAAGICLGTGCATKWNAVFVLAAFGLLTWAWEAGARRAIGVHCAHLKAVLRDGVPAFLTVVGGAVVAYLASWAGWFASDKAHLRTWAEDHPASGFGVFVPDALRSLWHYHAATLEFHEQLTDKHDYMSDPLGWLLINRPVSFSWDSSKAPGCPDDECVREILGIGTPLLWWTGCIALAACLGYWLWTRDWRFALPLVGVAATWLPWMQYRERPIFFFYASVILPFVVIALTLVFGLILGRSDAGPRRRYWGAAIVGGCVLLIVLNFIYFYPLLTDQLITRNEWAQRMWFRSWI